MGHFFSFFMLQSVVFAGSDLPSAGYLFLQKQWIDYFLVTCVFVYMLYKGKTYIRVTIIAVWIIHMRQKKTFIINVYLFLMWYKIIKTQKSEDDDKICQSKFFVAALLVYDL